MRVVFMGSPAFAVPSLRGLLQAGHDVVRVICQPDKPRGRGQVVAACPVHEAALAAGCAVSTPAHVRGKQAVAFLDEIEALQPDVVVVAAYGKILSTRLLQIPRLAPVNVHASILPRWRGASPIQHAVLAGDVETGVSIMHMDAGLDTGGVYRVARTAIGPDETAGELSARLAELGAATLIECLPGIADGSLRPQPQPDDGVTLAPLLGKDDGRLDFARDALALARRVRAMNPWPGAWTRMGGKILKVHRAQALDSVDTGAPPGQVLATREALLVACGQGALRVDELQLEGKRRMTAAEFVPGARLEAGARLGDT